MENLTQEGYLKWHREHPELYDELGEKPGACWSGACYILDTLGQEIREDGNVPPKYKEEYEIDKLKELEGWGHFLADCGHEVHYFSIYKENKEEMTIVHVYGTLKKTRTTVKRWIEKYKRGRWLEIFEAKNKGIPREVSKIEVYKL